MTDDPIRLTGIRFARGGRTIFDGLDLTIPPGRSTALVAPSGAGKSTLLALIAGLVEPDAGHVSTPFTAAETGLVLQAYGLAGLLTAAENIEVALQARRGLRRAEIRRRAAQVLEQVHLTAVADHLVEELSGGQQQRVAVARALAVAAPTTHRGRVHRRARPQQPRRDRRPRLQRRNPRHHRHHRHPRPADRRALRPRHPPQRADPSRARLSRHHLTSAVRTDN